MTRLLVYNAALVVFTAATIMTIAAINTPHWLSYSAGSQGGNTFEKHIGLHRECTTSAEPQCQLYPRHAQCEGDERYFCSMWRSGGFLMSFAVIFEMATIVSFIVIMLSGKATRIRGWPIITVLLVAVAAVEFSCMSLVAYLFDNDEQFGVPGWHLDTSWYLCTFSAIMCIVCAVALLLSAYILPQEDGYELLDDNLEDVA
ncbi:hypothetical protein MKZ38_002938 [Zalerion maritima]|uniref:Uncharacterized protein n=1 Tax=Zalerion maritima TaxID=339359 RepID=A0AAD5RNA0_9PEZI|nr:hypothetical protein MKZ38_002938 [Zalerion maritima]